MSETPENFDPYRYGRPTGPTGRSTPTGRQILSSSWQLLRQDRHLIVLPLLGTLFGLIAFAALFVPGVIIAVGNEHSRIVLYVFAIVGGMVASVIGIFFQAALVAGAYQRADGGTPSVGSALAQAWQLRRQVLGWAVLAATVGAAIRALEQRLGLLGRLLGFLGGIAWAVATFFVVPAIVAEGIGPIAALKRSAGTIREIWGTGVRTTLRFGALQLVLSIVPIALLLAGLAVATSGGGAVAGGGVLIALGVISLLVLGLVLGAVSVYARALIYRWASGRPVPGIDPSLFAGAFAARRGRFRR